jgi:hypothetical protein
MAEEENAEVRLKLVADDGTSETTAKMQASMMELSETTAKLNEVFRSLHDSATTGMGGVAKNTDHAKDETTDLWKEVFKGEAAFELAKKGAELVGDVIKEAVLSMKELAEEAISAAAAEDKQMRAMTGVLGMIDANAHSMSEVQNYASGLHDELEEMGRVMGVSADTIGDAFMMIEERTNKTSEEVKDLVGDMALVGKVTTGGMQGLGQGFAMMEMGMIKAKNPVVQLIAATHLLQGNAHAVAQQLQKMAPEKALALGEEAIRKMADQMSKAGPRQLGLDELKASFGGTKEMLLETMGHSMLDRLLPPLNRLKDFLAANEDALNDFAAKVGQDVGDIIDFVDSAIEGVYAGIHDNWEEIKRNYDEIFGDWRAAWDYALTNSDGIKLSFKDITKSLIDTFTEVSRYLKAAAEVAMDAYDLISGKNAGTTQAKIAGEAVGGKVTDVSSKAADFDLTAAKYRQLALESGAAADQVDAWITHMRDLHEQNLQDAEKMGDSLKHGEYETVSSYLDSAIEANSDSAQKYAFSLIAQSQDAQRALLAGGIHIAGGMDALMNLIKDKSPELARSLANAMNPIKAQGGIKPAGSVVNFNGGQTFHIKQDFRNEDPDRIAFVFRRDVVKSAEARRQSRVGTPFGL